MASFFALSEYHSPLIHRSAPVLPGRFGILGPSWPAFGGTFRNKHRFPGSVKTTFRNMLGLSDRFGDIACFTLSTRPIFIVFGKKPLLPRKVRPKNLHLPGMWPLLADIHENCLSKTFSEAFQNPISHFPSDKPSFSRQVLFQQIELTLFLVFVRGSSSVRSSSREFFIFPIIRW